MSAASSTREELAEELLEQAELHPSWPLPWMGVFLEAYAHTPSLAAAATQAGVAAATVHRRIRRDRAFAGAVEEARAALLDLVEYTAYLWGTTGRPMRKTVRKQLPDGVRTTVTEWTDIASMTAMIYLERYYPEYRANYHQHEPRNRYQPAPAAAPGKTMTEQEAEEVREIFRRADAREEAGDAPGAGRLTDEEMHRLMELLGPPPPDPDDEFGY